MKTYISPWPESVSLPDFPRSVSILGATGSIGDSAFKVIRKHPGLFTVAALAGGRNGKKLAELCAEFRPAHVCLLDHNARTEFLGNLPAGYEPETLVGPEGYVRLASLPAADVVLSSIVGAAGFEPTLAAAQAGKMICLANKESLVLGGHLIRKACTESGAVILPVDSEHNAPVPGNVRTRPRPGHQATHPDRIGRSFQRARPDLS